MTKLHLADANLQQAADGAPLPTPAATHLRACGQCQARVATYRHLFAATARLSQPTFEFDLAATVLARLPRAKPAFSGVFALVAILVLGVVGAFVALFGGIVVQAFRGLSTGLGAGLGVVAAFVVAGQGLELLARHRRQMRLLTFS